MVLAGRLCAGVILFHPDQAVLGNVASYAKEVECLYLADNTEPQLAPNWGTGVLPAAAVRLPMGGNKGVATALNAMARKARDDGFAWMLAMDQDASFPPTTLRSYLAEVEEAPEPGKIAVAVPLHMRDESDPRMDLARHEQLQIAMTAHSLINLEAHAALGGFWDELFIDEVDHEYCLRAVAAGYRVVRCNRARILHHPGCVAHARIRGREVEYLRYSPGRLFTIIRNAIVLRRVYGARFPGVTRDRMRQAAIVWRQAVRFQPAKLTSVRAGAAALVAGLLFPLSGFKR